MSDEVPIAAAYRLEYRTVEAKGSGEWRRHKVTPSRSVAQDFLDSSPEDYASRVLPMRAVPEKAVTVTGVVYDHPTRAEWEAAGR